MICVLCVSFNHPIANDGPYNQIFGMVTPDNLISVMGRVRLITDSSGPP